MAKRKTNNKEVKEEVIEEVVQYSEPKIVEDIEPIDMTESIEEIKKEIFEETAIKNELLEDVKEEVLTETAIEEPKKEEVKQEVKKENKPKNKFIGKIGRMFGFTWNGQEYDY